MIGFRIRLGLLLTGLLLLSGLLDGCSPAASHTPNPPGPPSGTTRQQRAQGVIDAFVAAGRRGDTSAAAQLVSARAPAFAGRAAIWAANLHRIEWSELTWTVTSRQREPPAGRQQEPGAAAWTQQVTVDWALPGETRNATEELWLTFVDEPNGTASNTQLAGDDDHPAEAAPMPIWLQQPARLHRDGTALMLADAVTDADDAADWVGRASAARRVVAERALLDRAEAAGPLVVELPQSRTVFERILGVEPASYSAVAAAAWPMGRTADTAPIHVVVNPEASRRLSGLGRDVLLIHEAVHVMSRSPISPAPTWLVEGYADEIAYATHPAARQPAEQSVLTAVRERGAPTVWPSEAAFAPGAADLDLAYNLAWTACHSIADAYGAAALAEFYGAVDAGASLDEAAARIGTTEKELRTRWQRDLEALAGG